MRWSLTIAEVRGIRIQVHVTFVLLIAWIALSYWQLTHTVSAVLDGVGFIFALFACVVLHELGHALTARRFGIRTRSITLLPIGGVAAVEKMPDDPRLEIVIALAGPVVSLAIALALYLFLQATGSLVDLAELGVSGGPFLQRLMIVNILLAVFNLLPAFPMDGGRVFRALLSLRLGNLAATRVAASVGQAMALLFALLGLLYNPFLFLIAVFIWIGAATEAGTAGIRYALADVRAADAMLTEFHSLAPGDSLAHAVQLTLAGSQKDFPVIEGDAVVGVLTQADMLRGLQSLGGEARVGSAMQAAPARVAHDQPMTEVLDRLQETPARLAVVMDGPRAAGLIDLDNVLELIRIQAARSARRL